MLIPSAAAIYLFVLLQAMLFPSPLQNRPRHHLSTSNFHLGSCSSTTGVAHRDREAQLQDEHDADVQTDPMLGSLLMKSCNPPQRRFRLEDGVPSPWWPKGTEDWWIEARFGLSGDGKTVSYKKPYNSRKFVKAGVITSIFKHVMPKSRLVCSLIFNSKKMQFKMTARESMIWVPFVEKEEDRFWNNGHNMLDVIADSSRAFLLERTGCKRHRRD